MKKIALLLCGIFIYLASFGQAVSERAVIPVSVNLISILRLTIVSGGNIEFTFTSIDDYNSGITGLSTVFEVASSQDFDVNASADAATLAGTDDPTNTLAGNTVELDVTVDDGDGVAIVGGTDIATIGAGATVIVNGGTAGTTHSCTIDWECGVTNPVTGVEPDRYATNVYLTVGPDL